MSYKKKSLYRSSLPKLPFIFFIELLRFYLKDCKTILDVGCGYPSPLRFVSGVKTGIDAYKPSVLMAKKEKTHDFLLQMDIRDIRKKLNNKSYDAVVALDVIEHLPKKGGIKLLKDMESLAQKYVVIFTPNGFHQQHDDRNSYEEHLSGWTVSEMKKKDYTVRGIFGYKRLRGPYHRLKFKPEFFWGLVSEITQFYTYFNPENAAALLCIKKINTSQRKRKPSLIPIK